MKIPKDAITGASPDNKDNFVQQRRAFTFYDKSGNAKGRLSTPKAFASVLSNTFGSYEGLSEQLHTRNNSAICTQPQQQTGKLQNNNPFTFTTNPFTPMAKQSINRSKLKDQEDVRKFLAKFF